MYSTMAQTKRLTGSPSEIRTISPRCASAYYYLPSIVNAAEVGKIDEIVLQRKVSSDGKKECSYTVRWQHGASPLHHTIWTSTSSLENLKQRHQRKKKEKDLSDDFFQMLKFDKEGTKYAQYLSSDAEYENNFSSGCSSREKLKGKTCEVETRNKPQFKSSTSTIMLSPLSKSVASLDYVPLLSPTKQKSTIAGKLAQKEKVQTAQPSVVSSIFSASDMSNLSKCKSLIYSSTPRCHGFLRSTSESSMNTKEVSSQLCLSIVLVDVMLMDLKDGDLRVVEISDHLCCSLKISEVLDLFSKYRALSNLTTNQKLFIGAVRSNSLDSKKFVIITNEIMDKTLEDIDNKTGVIRIIAINSTSTK